MSQSLIWSTQPIFISSTFSDMNAERDVLRDIVTIDLQDMLNERRVRLEPIDFRWGIDTSDEKEKEQKELMVLKVCLEDIDRSDPFFIGLIGDRYGWVPPEKRMKDAEKEKGFESKLKDKSVTALEIEYGVLASEKQLKRSFFFFREPLPYDEMPEDVKALYHDSDPDNQNRLIELKEEIEKSVGKDSVFTYKAEWDKQGNKVTGLRTYQRMKRRIRNSGKLLKKLCVMRWIKNQNSRQYHTLRPGKRKSRDTFRILLKTSQSVSKEEKMK